MRDWPAIRSWRKAMRKDLIAKRSSIPPDEKRRIQGTVGDLIRSNFPDLNDASICFYWPINDEIDLRPLLRDLFEAGADVSLPVVVQKNQPLEFWAWHPDTEMARGVANIPVPRHRKPAAPSAMLIPLLGFDDAGHRLGYGGGYYDRTLAAFRLRPFTIGVGCEMGHLSSIYPQAHDIPLDAVVTEAGIKQFDRDQTSTVTGISPPCYQHAVDTDNDPT